MTVLAALEHVGVVAEGRRVLDDVELSLSGGETVAVQGANGAGKTLLMRVLCGLAAPTEGRVRLFGEDLTRAPARRWAAARLRLGVAFQGGSLINELTVAENIAFPLLMAPGRPSPAAIAARLEHALVTAGLYRVASLLPWQLSSGQVRLAALARATVARPELLLLDDLFAGLDDVATAEMQQRFLAARPETTAVLLVTSDAGRVAGLADRMLRLELGVLQPAD